MTKPHGTYKIRNRSESDRDTPVAAPDSANDFGGIEGLLDEIEQDGKRAERLLESLREEILAGNEGLSLRIRQVFKTPREIFRLEIELPEHAYQRTTFLERDTLESLLEDDAVRAVIETGRLGAE